MFEKSRCSVSYREAIHGAAAIRVLSFLLVLFLCSSRVFGAEPGEGLNGPKMRVAVMDLSGKLQTSFIPGAQNFSQDQGSLQLPLQPTELARGLTEMLTTELVRTGKFVVLERAALQQITGEQDFAGSDRANAETAASRGLITGAQALIAADVTEFSYDRSKVSAGISFAGFGAKVDRVTAILVLHVRVIDAVTGEVMFSERVKGTSSGTGVSSNVTGAGDPILGFAAQENKPIGRASRKAVERAVAAITSKLETIPWQGRIVDVRGNDVYVNAGSEQGIQIGMQFHVYERQQALMDPDSGRILGAPERRVGTINIVSVEDKYSVARSIGGESLKRNLVLRPVERLAKHIPE